MPSPRPSGIRQAAVEPRSLRLSLRQAPRAVRRAVAHPGWLLAKAAGVRHRLLDRGRRLSPDDYARHGVDEREAAIRALEATPAGYEGARDAFWAPAYGPGTSLIARPALQSLVNVTVRLVQPDVMVETGVARGVSTAIALAGMADSGRGHLYSVDLPPLAFTPREVGSAVPTDLRGRWTLELGPSRSVLPGLLARVAPVDVFLHDADHAYGAQLEEYRCAWPFLRCGGVLLSDDVASSAFLEFADEVGAHPLLIPVPRDGDAIGIVVKP